ncbi:uncharacterized protein LOC118407559 [Branchiostoma floridae]|uniref:Uncharacterized protein LOC118407559 n=1 Tax=Branchiostoma floridae TaxID=7739 RepID=A0A9J7HR21_BRAFL|nr:uncharacterized protein LOC118407559 [Branchiostoma floridae]
MAQHNKINENAFVRHKIYLLKYGETRQAKVHLREPDPVTGSTYKVISLSTNREKCQQELEPYIHLRTKERKILPKASKIEIFWPLAFLKGGVTIVDSPGVGESEMMDEVVAEYIPSAFAFIYIIDSSCAGGEHKDRLLGQLLSKCKDLEHFDPTKAIFVLNKWDLVPEKERQEVKEEIIRKLGEMWEGLNESRVFVHSNKEAVKGGFRSTDFNKLLDGIYDLLPQSLSHKLAVQYRQMTSILKEALLYIKLKLNESFSNLDVDERREAFVGARTALAQFDASTAGIIKEVRDYLEDAIETAKSILAEFVRGELGERLAKEQIPWSVQIPENEEDILKDICFWMEDEMVRYPSLKNHISQVKEVFEVKLGEMVTRVKYEHSEKIRPITGRTCRLNVENMELSTRELFLLMIRMAIKAALMDPMFFLPVHHKILYASTLAGFIGSVLKHSDESLARLSELAIACMTTDERLDKIVRYHLTRPFRLLSNFESELQGIKEVDKRLVEERFAETRSQMDLVSTYQPQESQIGLLLGRLAMVQLTEMREYEFDLDGIIGWPDPQNRIAGGSYGEVYRVQVQQKGSLVRAALKVGVLPYDITTEENAWDFLTEEDNLRKLQGEHIVEYYGTACRKERHGLKLGLVMELCDGTLESRIIGHTEHNPSRWGHDPVMKQRAFNYIKDKAIKLCEGLRTIHDAGYIHRDLKLSNVLVTAGDVVKLADVGVTKREADVTGTITGTATYAAPEVKERKVYDKSADIYSLGIILWEMWYGRTVDGRSLRGLMGGDSMPNSPDSIRPIPEWETLVRDCVNRDARRRPTALECLQRIRSMTMEDRPRTSATPHRRTGPRLRPYQRGRKTERTEL